MALSKLYYDRIIGLKIQRYMVLHDQDHPLKTMLLEQKSWHQVKKRFIFFSSDDPDEVALAAVGLHGLRELRQLSQVSLRQKLGPLSVVVVQNGVKNVGTL